MGTCVFFAARTNVFGCPKVGKYGIAFSGRRASMDEVCFANWGQLPLSELVCLEEVPQETQWGSLG